MKRRKRRNNRWAALLVAAMATLVTACQRMPVYSRYAPVAVTAWEKAEALTFDVAPITADGTYAQHIGLRTTSDYPFTGLSLVIEQQVGRLGKSVTDTLACPLTNPEGAPLGKGIGHYQYLFPLRQHHLAKGDTLHVRIRHNMKRETLPGITDVGVVLFRQ